MDKQPGQAPLLIAGVLALGLLAVGAGLTFFLAGSQLVPGSTTAVEGLTQGVNDIRAAELAYDEIFGEVVSCRSRAEAVAALGKPFTDAPCWRTISWMPEEGSVGQYWVEVEGERFTVYGVADLDADGEIEQVVATRAAPAALP